MRLNASILNGNPLNRAGSRIPVTGTGSAVTELAIEVSGQRTTFGNGTSTISFIKEFVPSVERFGTGTLLLTTVPSITPTIIRGGMGSAVLGLQGSLHFYRIHYLSGELTIGLHARGDVGVQFGSGAAVLTPLEVELAPSRLRASQGTAAIGLEMEFLASAIRRPSLGNTAPLMSFGAHLEPSHITGGGIRYIGMFGDVPVSLSMEDLGMIRQAYIGTMDLAVVAPSLTATARKPTLAGKAIQTLSLSGSFRTSRRGEGQAIKSVLAECDGLIFVPGAGEIPVNITAQGSGRVTRKAQLGNLPLGFVIESAFVRARTGSGSAVVSIGLEGAGTRKRLFSGPMIIDALTFGDALLNPDAEDIDTQVFSRPGFEREFIRSAFERNFSR